MNSFDLSSAATTTLFGQCSAENDYPEYCCDELFNLQIYADLVETYNVRLWTETKTAICLKLGIPIRTTGYGTYSTRRVRRLVVGSDLVTVQKKQITIPVVVSSSLEDYLLQVLPRQYDVPSHFLNSSALIPIHEASNYDPWVSGIPSLYDITSESGNLRYWVITKESMWANQNPVLDVFAEVMWCMVECFGYSSNDIVQMDIGTSRITSNLVKLLRRRMILPETPGEQADSMRAKLFFNYWARMPSAETVEHEISNIRGPDGNNTTWDERDSDEEESNGDEEQSGSSAEEAMERDSEESGASLCGPKPVDPQPYDYAWQDGDEGDWDGDGAPAWIDVTRNR